MSASRAATVATPRLAWLSGFLLLAVLVFAVGHLSEEQALARLLAQAQPIWLLLAALLQAFTYVCAAAVWQRALLRHGVTGKPWSLVPLGLAKLFTDQALPSAGVSGTLLVIGALGRRGVARGVAVASVLAGLIGYYAAYLLATLGAVVILGWHGELRFVILVPVALLCLLATGVPLALVVLRGRALPRLSRWLERLPGAGGFAATLRHAPLSGLFAPRLLLETSVLQFAIFSLDALTLAVTLRAVGTPVDLPVAFASFVIASIVATLAWIPGGLGTFEGTCVAMLHLHGVSVESALAATLLLRGFSFWLPMLPGFALARREITGKRALGVEDGMHAPAGRIEHETLAELLSRLGTREEGLSNREAEERLRAFGPNQFGTPGLRSKLAEVLRSSVNPLVVILLVAAAASALLGEIVDAAIIGAIVLLSAGLNFWQTFRSDRAVRQLQERIAPTASVRRDGAWVELARREIVAGDVVRLAAGDLVPADARLLTAADLHVQQAALTGESLPAEKNATRGVPEMPGPQATELVFLGTSVVSGAATAVVLAIGRGTAFGDIVARLAARPDETEFERGTRRFGMMILQTVLFLVLFILAVNLYLGRDPLQSLLFSVALAVGLTPEFLPMITSVTLAQGALRMAREKVIVKHLSAIQNLGSIDILCSDKTGTLTAGTMSLDESLDPFGHASPHPLFLAQLNSRFETGIKSPLDTAILEQRLEGIDGFSKTDEIPFDFERRRLSIVVQKDAEILLVTKGAPEGVLGTCSHWEADGSVHALDDAARARCLDVFHAASARGFRALAVAYRRVTQPSGFTAADERELTLTGFLTFADHLLEGVDASLARLRNDGVEVKILTGDNELVTRHICDQVGIDAGRIVLGSEIESLDEVALARVAEQARVFARVSPAQKHRILRALKAGGHVVGFLGDGINDAPSLHAADVGISVAGAVDIAREASDIVLLERHLDVLHAGIIAGRKSFGNVLKYLLMGTSSNFGNMLSMAGAALFLPFLPMLPTQILLNNFLYDFAQITIPTDNIDPTYVRRPQRWDMRLIRNFMLTLGPVSSLYDFLTFFALLYIFRFGETLFHTGWFLESLATQTLVLFVIRTAGRPWTNRPSTPLIATTLLVVAIGFAVPYTPLAPSLGFEAPPARFLLFLGLVVVTYLFIVEVVKERMMRRLFPAAHSAPAWG